MIRQAAPLDPEIEALWNRIQTDFYDNQRAIVKSLDGKDALARRARRRRAATDILWTLNHPDMWQLLVGQRGWTPDAVRAVVRRHGLRAAARAAVLGAAAETRSIAAPTVCA